MVNRVWLLLICAATAWCGHAVAYVPDVSEPTLAADIDTQWLGDVERGLSLANAEYRPLLVMFLSPDCGWCARFRAYVQLHAGILKLLEAFVTVEVDVTVNPETAARYGVRGVPSFAFLSGDGRVQDVVDGYMPPEVFEKLLKSHLNPNFVREQDQSYRELIADLGEGSLSNRQWTSAIRYLGDEEKRDELRALILPLNPFPATNLVSLLRSHQLAVRCGALELLEEKAGDDFGFDPWVPPDADLLLSRSLARWETWAGNRTNVTDHIFAGLTSERIETYLRDLVSDDHQRVSRARRMLHQGGQHVARELATFLKETPDLAPAQRQRIRAVEYAILMNVRSGFDASAAAHRLVFGNLDARLKGIRALGKMSIGLRAVPILNDFLKDESALIREVSVETLILVVRHSAVPLVETFLEDEQDPNVIYAALRALGNVPDPRVVALLTTYIGHEHEDLAIISLDMLKKLKAKSSAEAIAASLRDSRWRVRAAGLDVVGELKLSGSTDAIRLCLDDEDDYVRMAAAKALCLVIPKSQLKDVLAPLFSRDDGFKGLIARQFASHQLPMPSAFRRALNESSKETILDVIQGLEYGGISAADFVAPYADDDDVDISCAALRLLARSGLTSASHRGRMARVLRQGDPEHIMTILRNITISKQSLRPYRHQFRHWREDGGDASTVEPAGMDEFLGALMAAFQGVPPPEPTRPSASPAIVIPGEAIDIDALVDAFDPVPAPSVEAIDVDALMGAFTSGDGASAAPVEVAKRMSLPAFIALLESMMQTTEDATARLHIAQVMAGLGNPAAIPILHDALDEQPTDVRIEIVRALRDTHGQGAALINRKLLRDESDRVRGYAVDNLMRNTSSSDTIDWIFEVLLEDDSPLTPGEVAQSGLSQLLSRPASRRRCRHWARHLLGDNERDPALRVLAVSLLGMAWSPGDEKLMVPLLKHEDPYHRRAAAYALGVAARRVFIEHLDAILNDPSTKVRAVIPAVASRELQYAWVHRFSDDDTSQIDAYSSYGYLGSRGAVLGDELEQALWTLTRDPDIPVSVDAYFALLHHRRPVDLAAFAGVLDRVPDSDMVADRLASFMYGNVESLGDEFKALMPYVMRSDTSRYYADRLTARFGKSLRDDPLVMSSVLSRLTETNKAVQATYREHAVPPVTNAPSTVKVIYFYSPGCDDCEDVEAMLKDALQYFPELNIERYNIHHRQSMLFNEVLCTRFSVPDKVRMVAPSLFMAGGALIKEEIAFSKIAELIALSDGERDMDWARLPVADRDMAEDAIEERFASMNMGLVVIAGLADGVNPCAFATIIFLLSYLQVAHRSRREIRHVGLAFILGVFVTYYALGLGLYGIIERLTFLPMSATVINVVAALFVLVLAILNLRDGVLCRQGRMQDMVLQLPGQLKARIHRTIRHGARHHRYVMAALVVGVAVSFLELACTGQVYLPMITYMLENPSARIDALGGLLVYNLAFIAPLVGVFLLAGEGLSHKKLTDVMAGHAATVKFVTAGLFAVLFIMFVAKLI